MLAVWKIICGFRCKTSPASGFLRQSVRGQPGLDSSTRGLPGLRGLSARTIRADLVALLCYYPIQVVRGRFGGGIHLPDWFYIESRILSSKQQALLMRVRQTLVGDDLQVMNSILAQFALYWEYR